MDLGGTLDFREIQEGLRKMEHMEPRIHISRDDFQRITKEGVLCDKNGQIDPENFDIMFREELEAYMFGKIAKALDESSVNDRRALDALLHGMKLLLMRKPTLSAPKSSGATNRVDGDVAQKLLLELEMLREKVNKVHSDILVLKPKVNSGSRNLFTAEQNHKSQRCNLRSCSRSAKACFDHEHSLRGHTFRRASSCGSSLPSMFKLEPAAKFSSDVHFGDSSDSKYQFLCNMLDIPANDAGQLMADGIMHSEQLQNSSQSHIAHSARYEEIDSVHSQQQNQFDPETLSESIGCGSASRILNHGPSHEPKDTAFLPAELDTVVVCVTDTLTSAPKSDPLLGSEGLEASSLCIVTLHSDKNVSCLIDTSDLQSCPSVSTSEGSPPLNSILPECVCNFGCDIPKENSNLENCTFHQAGDTPEMLTKLRLSETLKV